LLDLTQAITDMWRRGALKTVDFNKLRMPRGGDLDIISTAESCADQAEPVCICATTRAFQPNGSSPRTSSERQDRKIRRPIRKSKKAGEFSPAFLLLPLS
jgi:hypothetical protein